MWIGINLSPLNNYTKIVPRLALGSEVPDIIQTQNRDFSGFMKKFPGGPP